MFAGKLGSVVTVEGKDYLVYGVEEDEAGNVSLKLQPKWKVELSELATEYTEKIAKDHLLKQDKEFISVLKELALYSNKGKTIQIPVAPDAVAEFIVFGDGAGDSYIEDVNLVTEASWDGDPRYRLVEEKISDMVSSGEMDDLLEESLEYINYIRSVSNAYQRMRQICEKYGVDFDFSEHEELLTSGD